MAERSPASWLAILEQRLDARWREWKVYDNYYEGNHRLAGWLRNARRATHGTVLGRLLDGLQINYMPLVVDLAAERMRVQGFQLAGDNNKQAWDIWQANNLDSQSNMVHTESIKLGEAYWLVQPTDGDYPRITAEHPSQVIVAHAPGDRRIRLAALKRWTDDDGYTYANVYLPDRVVKYRSQRNTVGQQTWGEGQVFPNPLGVVPVVPVPNNPSMLHGGRSDLAGGLTELQDAIEYQMASLLTGIEYHALPQRVMLGVEPPRDPETGKVVSDAVMQRQKLWYFNAPDAKVAEFSQADLQGIRASVDASIGDLAAQSRVPLYFFRPTAISNISAETLVGLDAALVSKAHDKRDPFGEGHEEMQRLAFRAIDPDDPRGRSYAAETDWKDTESRSEAQRTDAVVKLVAIGLPAEIAFERLGFSPQEVDRIMEIRELEGLLEIPDTALTAQALLKSKAEQDVSPAP